MAGRQYKFLEDLGSVKSTRARSYKQESKLAKQFKGRVTVNSGATFGQNDVISDYCEIEAKTTEKDSFSLRVIDLQKMRKKCATDKFPLFVIDYEKSKTSYAVIALEDLEYLISQVNSADK